MSILDKLDEKTGIVFDGNQFLYRTYHVLKQRSDGDLTPGFIAYSFTNQIRFAISQIKATNPVVFIIWDSPSSRNLRKNIFPDYKGNRKKSPDVLSTARRMLQIEFNHICPRLAMEYPNIEADDIIGILTDVFNDLCDRWVICTRDEDLVQCVKENVDYYNPYTKKLWTKAEFEEKYGFSLDRIPIYKALQGDDADNWGGVEGVGPKTVTKWFNTPIPNRALIQEIYDEKLIVKKTKKRTEDQAKLATDLARKNFLIGLNICKIPILDDISEVKDYIIEKLQVHPQNDFSRFHEVFEINDTDKASFIVGRLG